MDSVTTYMMDYYRARKQTALRTVRAQGAALTEEGSRYFLFPDARCPRSEERLEFTSLDAVERWIRREFAARVPRTLSRDM